MGRGAPGGMRVPTKIAHGGIFMQRGAGEPSWTMLSQRSIFGAIVRTALFLVVRCVLGARCDALPLMPQGAVALGQPGRRWCIVSRSARRRGLLRHSHAVSLYDLASGGVGVALDLAAAQHRRRAEGSGYNTCKPHSLAQSLGEDT